MPLNPNHAAAAARLDAGINLRRTDDNADFGADGWGDAGVEEHPGLADVPEQTYMLLAVNLDPYRQDGEPAGRDTVAALAATGSSIFRLYSPC